MAALSQLHYEDFHLDQAIKESKREFRAAVVAAGGNPDIAEEVFKSALETPIIPPSSSSPHGKAASSSKTFYASEGATVAEPNNDDPWHDDDDANSSLPEKDSESIEGSSEKTNTPGSLEEFIASIHNLSREEIISGPFNRQVQQRVKNRKAT